MKEIVKKIIKLNWHFLSYRYKVFQGKISEEVFMREGNFEII